MNPIFKKLPLLVLCGVMTVGCTKFLDQIREEVYPPVYGGSPVAQLVVKSGPSALSGETHRSSENFSTNSLINYGDYLLWSTDSDDNVSFTLMQDKLGSDRTVFGTLYHGAITKFEGGDKFYIADPRNTDKDFNITVMRISGVEGSVYINSAKDHQARQTHRASENFNLLYGRKYKVIAPDGHKFSIMSDISGTDNIIKSAVGNGDIFTGVEENIYVADATGASQPFTIVFEPYEQVQSSWMKSLPDNTKVGMMSIPGTHDSGTFVFDPGLARCQNYDFYIQLLDGIRWLDVRLYKNLHITHGVAISDLTFAKVMEDVNTFLNENPSETVFMMIKEEISSGELYESLKKWYNDNKNSTNQKTTSSKVILDGQMHELGDIRGKVVLLRRFDITFGDPSFGVDLTLNWPDNGSGLVYAHYDDGFDTYYVEDRYFSQTESHDTNEKKAEIRAAFDSIKDADASHIYLIYNSVSGHLASPFAWDYAWGGTGINPCMMDALDNLMDTYYPTGSGRMGVIFLDFYNKHANDDNHKMVDRIINSNFSSPIIK